MDLKLNGKRALVTGATRGIGRAIAAFLAGEGAKVSICARHRRDVEETVKAEGLAFGAACDVAQRNELEGWIEASAKHLGGIDVLVANASALTAGATAEAFSQAFQTDLMHTVNAVTMALPWLEQSSSGSIVAISSISGVEDYGFDEAAYGTMKAALIYYIKTLSGALAPRGIRANVVSPGTTYFIDGFWHHMEIEDAVAFKNAMDNNPMGRMASPEDIANAVAFLAGETASFITGVNLVVDGGYTRRAQF